MVGISTVVAGKNVKVQHHSIFLDAVQSGLYPIKEVTVSKSVVIPGGVISTKAVTVTIDLVSKDEVLVTQSNPRGKTTVSFQLIEMIF